MTRARFVVAVGTHGVDVFERGEPVSLTPTQQRLVDEVATAGGAATIDDLIDAVWDGTAPSSARASLHNHLSRLRERAPGLITRDHDLYRLASDVEVIDRTAFPGDGDGDGERSVEALRRTVAAEPHDERASAELTITLASGGHRADALAEIERLRRALADVGLEPGRRATDLARLVADGERRTDRLAGSTRIATDIGLSIGSFASDDLVATARRWLRSTGDAILVVRGAPGSGRTHALRLVRDLALTVGVEPVELSCDSRSSLPMLSIGSWTGRAPRLVIVDDADRATDATRRVIGRLAADSTLAPLKVAMSIEPGVAADAIDSLRTTFGRPTALESVELTAWDVGERRRLLERLDVDATEIDAIERSISELGDLLPAPATLDAIRLAVGTHRDRREFERIVAARSVLPRVAGGLERALIGAMVDQLDEHARRLLELLALTATPMMLDDLGEMVPDLRTQIRRHEVRRLIDLDEVRRRIRLRDRTVVGALLDGMSPRRRVELHAELAEASYEHEVDHLRARRWATHGAEADLTPVAAAASMRDLAAAVAAVGDRLTAADISQIAAGVVFAVDPEQFCDSSIRAGSELLTAGDPVGLSSITAALDVAIAHGLTSLAARATFAYCGLGPTSGAGRIDESAAELIERVDPMLTDHADRALLLTSWTMVHTLTGDSIRCAESFDRAEHHARASGEDGVLAMTLPSAYMSLAAPEHLDRREAIAAELHALAARTGDLATEWEATHLDVSNLLQRGDPAVRTALTELVRATEPLDGRQHDWEVTYLRAVVAQIDGDLDGALRLAEESLEAEGVVGDSRRSAVFGAIVLGHHLATGRVGELAPFLEGMIAEQPLLAAWRAPLALAAAEAGDDETAFEQLSWLIEPGAIQPDCTMSAVVAVAGTAAAVVERSSAADVDPILRRFTEMLTPWSGRWTWYGAGTYGPIDTTLARLHAALGDRTSAIGLATAAAHQAARMRAPVYSSEIAEFITTTV